MNNTIKLILVFLLAVILGFGVVIIVKKSNGEDTHPPTDYPGSNGPVKIDTTNVADTTFVGLKPKEEPIAPDAPQLLTNRIRVQLYVGKTSYYYTVKGIQVSEESEDITYTLTDSFGHEYTSDNGEFTHVDANNAGTYTIVAEDAVTGLSSEPEIITGFKVVNPVASPLTASELTNLIMTGDYEGNEPQLKGKLAKSLSVKCLTPDYSYNTIQEVFISVLLENWTITVTSLEYNCLRQVTRINLSAQKQQ